ncbi:MAG TPA: nitrogen regulation protein NR(II) [Casimicrobiaceae bacterium]|nr:nitrogen regulation protein NR(II) [Casimicrobiaceae bacterium]
MRFRFSTPSSPIVEAAPTATVGLELLSTSVLTLDEGRIVRYANPAAENLFELSRSRLVGIAIGTLFPDSAALTHAIDHAARSNSAYTAEEIELTVVGRSRLHLTATVTPIEQRDMLLLEFRHVDQQLKIAREERQREQQQANRELIRNLAHEIKNPLGGIRGAAQLLERELPRRQLAEYTQVIIDEADRLQGLVDRLLTPHRLPVLRPTNVHEVLVRVKDIVQAEFPTIPIVCDFDASLPEIAADPAQLTQAMLNVVRNAGEALAGTTHVPRIGLTTRVARYVTLARRRHRLAIAVTVEDNGPGVPAAIRDRIFFPLVSGREGGSGLGLTIAQTFIAQHNGTIECESEPGRTVFRTLLPLSDVTDR